MELWAQRSKAKTIQTALDQEGDMDFLTNFLEAGGMALTENLSRKAELDLILQSGGFTSIHALVFKFDANPGVATAGVFAPEVDFADNQLQDLNDENTPLQYVSYSIIPSEAGGHAIIGWHDLNPIADQFTSSLLSLDPAERPDALLRVAFESLENTYFSSLWWDGLNAEQKEQVGARAVLGAITPNPISYKPDGIHLTTVGSSIIRHH